MALDTTNEKLALMEEEIWEPALPIGPGTFGTDDKQQLLWGYPGILWGASALLGFVLDMNTRLLAFLRSNYSVTGGDLTTLATRYCNEQTGERTARWRKLETDATSAMGASVLDLVILGLLVCGFAACGMGAVALRRLLVDVRGEVQAVGAQVAEEARARQARDEARRAAWKSSSGRDLIRARLQQRLTEKA